MAYGSDESGSWDIYVMDSDGTNRSAIGNAHCEDTCLYPAISPDGTKVAYSSNFQVNETLGNHEIYVTTIGGDCCPIRLTNNAAADMYPEWSPDGSKVVFGSLRDGNWEIYATNAARAACYPAPSKRLKAP